MRVVALLRGMNTGGVRFPMRDLAAALGRAGFGDVRTVLASGNVVLDAGSPATAAAGVRAVIAEAFGFDLAVVAVPLDGVRAAVDAFPFERHEDRHGYVVFSTEPSVLDGLLSEAVPGEETVRPGPGVLYWEVQKGSTLGSAFGTRLGRRPVADHVTTRNLRTLERIVAAG